MAQLKHFLPGHLHTLMRIKTIKFIKETQKIYFMAFKFSLLAK